MNEDTGRTPEPDYEEIEFVTPIADAVGEMVGAHEKWLESGRSEGAQANFELFNLSRQELSGRNLSYAIFSKANLKGAILRGVVLESAILEDANLQDADLRGANLTNANLKAANLIDCDLRQTILENAELADARGLIPRQLAGANLCRARLPETVEYSTALRNVEELSKSSRKLFGVLMLVCAYFWISLTGLLGDPLNMAAGMVILPLIDSEIANVVFYWLAPLLLLIEFIYFTLSLQRLVEAIGELPEVFVDGRGLRQTTHPWLVGAATVSLGVVQRRDGRRLMRLQRWISCFLAWWVAPLTLAYFMLVGLLQGLWPAAVFLAILTAVSGYSAVTFQRYSQTK